jgi:hypothetical protein
MKCGRPLKRQQELLAPPLNYQNVYAVWFARIAKQPIQSASQIVSPAGHLWGKYNHTLAHTVVSLSKPMKASALTAERLSTNIRLSNPSA